LKALGLEVSIGVDVLKMTKGSMAVLKVSDTITFTIWRTVRLQGKWRLLQIQMMIAPDFDIWGSDIQGKNLCKLLQSKVNWKVPESAN